MAKKIIASSTPNLDVPISTELIGHAIHAKRTQSLLRIEDAAALCGVAKQTFMQAEHGHPNTQISTILQICRSLGIKITITPWQTNEELNDEWQ